MADMATGVRDTPAPLTPHNTLINEERPPEESETAERVKSVAAHIGIASGTSALAGSAGVWLGASFLNPYTGIAFVGGLGLARLISWWRTQKAHHQFIDTVRYAEFVQKFEGQFRELPPALVDKAFIHKTFAGKEIHTTIPPVVIENFQELVKNYLEFLLLKNDTHPPSLDSFSLRLRALESLLALEPTSTPSSSIEDLKDIQKKNRLLKDIVDALIFYSCPCNKDLVQAMFCNESDIPEKLTKLLSRKFAEAFEEWDQKLKQADFIKEGSILNDAEDAYAAFFEEFKRQMQACELETRSVTFAADVQEADPLLPPGGEIEAAQDTGNLEALRFLEKLKETASLKAYLKKHMDAWYIAAVLPPHFNQLKTECATLNQALLEIDETLKQLESEKELQTFKGKKDYVLTSPLKESHVSLQKIRTTYQELQLVFSDEILNNNLQEIATKLQELQIKLEQLVDLKHAFSKHIYDRYATIVLSKSHIISTQDKKALEFICNTFSSALDQYLNQPSGEVSFEHFWTHFAQETAKHVQDSTKLLEETQLFTLSWKLPAQLKEETEAHTQGWRTYDPATFPLNGKTPLAFGKPGTTIAILIHATYTETRVLSQILLEIYQNKIIQEFILQALIDAAIG